jgi:large subunit ribosomal protein L10
MPNQINEIIVRQLSDEFSRAEGMVIVSLDGLTVQETEDLRNALAQHGARLRMVRNRLARIALKDRGLEPPPDLFAGNVACVCGSTEDTVGVAKAIQDSEVRKNGKATFRGGFFEGNLIDASGAQALASLPTKNELRAMMLGVISGPARSLATLIAAPGASLARVIQAHADKGEDA